MKSDEETIGSQLKLLRKSRGLTVGGLADKIQEDHQKVGRIERGARAITVDYLLKVSKALETPIEALLQQEKKEGSKKENFSLLNEIIHFFDQSSFSFSDPKEKANLITKVYERGLSFPQNIQKEFLTAVFDLLRVLLSRNR